MEENPFLQVWEPSETDRKAHDLAKRYHDEAEAYDRTVCTGPVVRGSIQPLNPWELAAVNRNASKLRAVIMGEAAKHGISAVEMSRAIGREA